MAIPSLGRNIAAMSLWQIATYVIPLVTFPYLTRTLGVRAFGEYGLAFAIAAFLVLLTDYGFNLSAPAEVARCRDDHREVSRVFWSVLAAKTVLLLVGGVVLVVVTATLPQLRSFAPVMLAASGMAVGNVLMVTWCLQGLERLGKVATALTVSRALTIPATFLLVHGPSDAWIAAAVQSGGAILGGIASLAMVAGLGVIRRPRVTMPVIAAQLTTGLPLFISAVSINIYTTANAVLLGVLRGPGEVGLFVAADRLRAAAQSSINPISQAAYPRAARLMRASSGDGIAFARRLLLWQGGFTLAVSILLVVGADQIIVLLAGPRFAASAPVLRILAPIPFLVGLSNVLGLQLMLPMGMQRAFSRILMLAAAIDLAMVVPLGRRHGAVGAAAALLVAEMVVTLGMALVVRRAGIRLWSSP